MAAFVYDTAKRDGVQSGARHGWTSNVLKVTLVSNNYLPAVSHQFASAFSGAELSEVTSFTAGFSGSIRKTLTSKTATLNTTSNQVEYDAADVTWSAFSAGTVYGCILLVESGFSADASAELLGFFSITPTLTNDTDFTLSWANSGLFVFASG